MSDEKSMSEVRDLLRVAADHVARARESLAEVPDAKWKLLVPNRQLSHVEERLYEDIKIIEERYLLVRAIKEYRAAAKLHECLTGACEVAGNIQFTCMLPSALCEEVIRLTARARQLVESRRRELEAKGYVVSDDLVSLPSDQAEGETNGE